MAIIPLARPLPAGSSDLPGGSSRFQIEDLKLEIFDSYAFEKTSNTTASGGQPSLRLPIWSCTARSLPGRACHHTRRCALTLSPCGPHRFTHHPTLRSQILESERVGWSVLCCTCRRSTKLKTRFQIGDLKFEISLNAPLLAGSLPFGVRTFLSFEATQASN